MVERGTVGEQFGEWLMGTETDEEGAPTRLEALSGVVGSAMARAGRFSKMQEGSVEARIQNKYDGIVHQGILQDMPIEIKLLKKAAEHFGIDFDEMLSKKEQLAFARSLAENGINLNMFNDGRTTSRGRM